MPRAFSAQASVRTGYQGCQSKANSSPRKQGQPRTATSWLEAGRASSDTAEVTGGQVARQETVQWNPTHAPTSTAWRSKLLTPSPSSRGVSQLPSISDQLCEATEVRPEEFWREAVVCQSLRRQTGRRPGGAGQQVGRVHSYGALNPQAQSQVGAFAAGSSLSVWGQSAGQDKADWARTRLGVLLSVHRRAVLALVMECALLTCQAWIKRQTGHFSLCFFVLPPILSSHHLPPHTPKTHQS